MAKERKFDGVWGAERVLRNYLQIIYKRKSSDHLKEAV